MKKIFIKYFSTLLLFILSIQYSFASHLRAADIVVQKVSGYTYQIEVNVFSDEGGFDLALQRLSPYDFDDFYDFFHVNGQSLSDYGVLDNIPPMIDTDFGNDADLIGRYVYRYNITLIPGLDYLFEYQRSVRNYNILNINDGSSQIPLYVSTKLSVPVLDAGSTPDFVNDPLFFAQKDEIFTYNPGAFDADGDSISFELVTPKTTLGEDIENYDFLDGMTMDAITGDIVWDYPTEIGEFNIAYIVREYRNGRQLGYVIRDVQIIVREGTNEPPLLTIPNDTCVVAGETFTLVAIAKDSLVVNSNLSISTNATEVSIGTVSWNETYESTDSVVYVLEWTPSCNIARDQEIIITFRAYDTPVSDDELSLSTFQSMSVTVLASPPANLTATKSADNSGIQLDWDDYTNSCTAMETITVWRADCVVPTLPDDVCEISSPEDYGFVEVATIDASQVTYFDNTASKGIKYYYALSANAGSPSNATSFLSDTASSVLDLDIPTLVKVDVLSTDENGSIQLNWISSRSTTLTTPITFDIYRVATTNFTEDPITDGELIATSLTDSSYTDNVNTQDSAYLYAVVQKSIDGDFNSEIASSTFLNLTGINEGVQLDWTNLVPWGNSSSLYHNIYEGTNFVSVQPVGYDTIGSIISTSMSYSTVSDLIEFREPCDSFYYYVELKGLFCSDLYQDTIINRTQISLGIPSDTIAPDTVQIVNETSLTECDDVNVSLPLTNSFSWDVPNTPGVLETPREDIVYYLVYKKKTMDDSLSVIDTLSSTETLLFDDEILEEDRSAIYAVTAVDEKGNESEFTYISFDNCYVYELPNIITPNGDGLNEVFIPIRARFIDDYEIKIYSRWGALVFESNDMNINWDASNVSDGTYFYEYKLTFLSLDEEKINKKGIITVKK